MVCLLQHSPITRYITPETTCTTLSTSFYAFFIHNTGGCGKQACLLSSRECEHLTLNKKSPCVCNLVYPIPIIIQHLSLLRCLQMFTLLETVWTLIRIRTTFSQLITSQAFLLFLTHTLWTLQRPILTTAINATTTTTTTTDLVLAALMILCHGTRHSSFLRLVWRAQALLSYSLSVPLFTVLPQVMSSQYGQICS